ncbi:MAG: NAD(P)H-dependent oxidoreductase [Spirosomataceae bacterium]
MKTLLNQWRWLFLMLSTCAFSQKALVIVAHPNMAQSEVNRQLLKAVSAMPNVTIHELYRTYPDEKINVTTEQQLLRTHQLIVFQFPLYWFSAPSLLKKWMDEVVTSKFALEAGNPLKGKKLLIATSAGGTADDFRHGGLMNISIDEALTPYEAFARLCQLDYQPAFVTYGVPNPTILNIKQSEAEQKERQQYIDNQAKMYVAYIAKLLATK